ncbi:MAG: tRNA-2-methylthio-N6-dimethylallyladenosine synthase [Acidobacteriota bacterium]|nr:tRNA-2-methylthio-N6-dimethylallyladenosine synthase [Acidobacteriota bacterium]
MNVVDSERIVTTLKSSGYEMTDESSQAEIVLLNTCSVRERAEQKVFNRLGELRHDKPQIFGVMGCVAQLEKEKLFRRAPFLNLVVGTHAIDRLPSLIDLAVEGRQKLLDVNDEDEGGSLDVAERARSSRWTAFVPIIEGCNKFCTYCIVPYSRGREKSRSAATIIKEIDDLRQNGYQEVQLIGQNVNSYRPKTETGLERFSGDTPFSRLLRAVAATKIPRVKFTTSFPRDFHPDIVAALDENNNLCNWIHLPVQSGSDKILKAMRRGYSVSDYLSRIEAISRAKRQYALTTDIIIGFPGESQRDFEDTMRLVRECRFHSIYIFKYSMRPNTPAAKLYDDVSKSEKTARFNLLEDVQREIQNQIFSEYIGRDVSVLVEGFSARSERDLTGHTTCNKVVNFPGDASLLGKTMSVTVTSAKSHSLYGQLS